MPRTHTLFTLTGWKAVAFLVAVAAFVVFRTVSARTLLDAQAQETLEVWIRGDVIRLLQADSTLSPTERGQAMVDAFDVSIRSVAARGPLDDTVVKVELDPNPAFPPEFDLVRYYRMRYSVFLGWTYERDSKALLWHLALF